MIYWQTACWILLGLTSIHHVVIAMWHCACCGEHQCQTRPNDFFARCCWEMNQNHTRRSGAHASVMQTVTLSRILTCAIHQVIMKQFLVVYPIGQTVSFVSQWKTSMILGSSRLSFTSSCFTMILHLTCSLLLDLLHVCNQDYKYK